MAQKEKLFVLIHIVGKLCISKFFIPLAFFLLSWSFQLSLLQQSVVDVDVEDVEMLLTLVAVTTWGVAVVEHLEASTDVDVDVEDVEHAEQTTGVPQVPCVLTAREDLVLQSLAQDATLVAAQVSLSLVHLAPL